MVLDSIVTVWILGIGDGLVYVDIGYVVFPSVNGVSPIPACWVVWLIVLLIGWHWKEWHGNGEWTVNWTSWTVELAIIGLIGPWKVCGNSSYSNSQLPTDQKSEKANIFLMPMPYAISHWDYAAWNWTAQQTRQRSLRDHFVTSLFQCALLHANYKAKKGITNCHESIPNPESYFLSTIDQTMIIISSLSTSGPGPIVAGASTWNRTFANSHIFAVRAIRVVHASQGLPELILSEEADIH